MDENTPDSEVRLQIQLAQMLQQHAETVKRNAELEAQVKQLRQSGTNLRNEITKEVRKSFKKQLIETLRQHVSQEEAQQAAQG